MGESKRKSATKTQPQHHSDQRGIKNYRASRTGLPFTACTGRALNGNCWLNSLNCSGLMRSGCLITSHRTPSEHGGVVRDPKYW